MLGYTTHQTLFQQVTFDEPKVCWDDNTCKLIPKECHKKNNHNETNILYDTKYSI